MTSPFKDALRDELRAATERDLARASMPRRWARIGTAVAALAAAVAGGVALLWPSPAAADIEIAVRNGRVEVRIVDLVTSPEEVREAMEAEGLDVLVRGAPVGPSNVGRFTSVQLEVSDERTIEQLGADGQTFDGFSIPEDWPGRLIISVGVPARPGQLYEAGSDAFAPEEPLHCVDIRGRTLAAAADRLSDLVVRVRAPLTDLVPLDEALDGELAGFYVVGGRAVAADEVMLDLDPAPPAAVGEDPTC